jgi:hypothetical protein
MDAKRHQQKAQHSSCTERKELLTQNPLFEENIFQD